LSGGGAVTNAGVIVAIEEDEAAVRDAIGFHVIDVRDYGAMFDNVTDDTAAINAAHAAAAAATGPAKVSYPPGTAVVSGPIILRGRDGLCVQGCGPYVTTIRSTSNSANVFQYRQPNNGQRAYLEFLELADFMVTGTGIPNSTAVGIHLHDDTTADDFFCGGSLKLRNLRIGANGAGFSTGLYLKRWDTFVIENVRCLYNYRNAYLEKFTKTGTIINGGNSQAESVLWDFGPGARVNMIGVDNGNAPQWYSLADGATVTRVGCNHETQRYSDTATRLYNYATSTYPTVVNLSAVDSGTGVFTAGASHGFKPGVRIAFGATASFPSPMTFQEVYEVAATGFDATHFSVLPVPRYGTVTEAADIITISAGGIRANFDDLPVDSKIHLSTEGIQGIKVAYSGGTLGGGSRLMAGEYWIVDKPSATTIKISDAEGGAPIVFGVQSPAVSATTTFRIRPTSPILPVALGTSMTAFCPPIALTYSAIMTDIDSQHTANSGVPLAVLGTGSLYNSPSLWHTSGFTTSGLTGQAATTAALMYGRIMAIGNNATVDGLSVPVTVRTASYDASIITYTTGRMLAANSDSGTNAATAANRGSEYLMLGKDSASGFDDKPIRVVRDSRGLYSPEPFLNREIPKMIAVTSATFATYSELKPRQKYRIDHSTASAALVMNLPDNSTTGTYAYTGIHTDERVSVDDEIEVMVVGANGQIVELHQGTASGVITYVDATLAVQVTTAGTTHGLSLVAGQSIRLKCTYTSGANVAWQVVGGVGVPTEF